MQYKIIKKQGECGARVNEVKLVEGVLVTFAGHPCIHVIENDGSYLFDFQTGLSIFGNRYKTLEKMISCELSFRGMQEKDYTQPIANAIKCQISKGFKIINTL